MGKIALSTPSPLKTGEYRKTKRMFFQQSKLLEAQITDLFDDVWPTITAWKNLRWQVLGYCGDHQDYTNDQISAKFVEPSDKSNHSNLYRKCILEPWKDQESRIAVGLLISLFACYEGWLEEILKSFKAFSQNRLKAFQFPGSFQKELSYLQSIGNQMLADAFFDVYKSVNKNYNKLHLYNYLVVYRFFKECRNCFIHGGGNASKEVVKAWKAYNTLDKEDVDVKQLPEAFEPKMGQPLEISLRGVVGFSQIVLKIVSTLDVEFILCKNAEEVFANTIFEFPHDHFPIKGIILKRDKMIDRVCKKAFFHSPKEHDDLYLFLKRKGIFL